MREALAFTHKIVEVMNDFEATKETDEGRQIDQSG